MARTIVSHKQNKKISKKIIPTFDFEKKYWNKKMYVIGLDEVGRGSLAGPMTVGAVCFQPAWIDSSWEIIKEFDINDSKVLTARRREVLTSIITRHTVAHATLSCSVERINRVGITKALSEIFNDVTHLVYKQLPATAQIAVLVDGILVPQINGIPHITIETIVDGDAKSLTIAAASIIAKVDRDHQMALLASKYPQYGWEKNRGYGTAAHIAALRTHGICELHRETFVDGILARFSAKNDRITDTF